MNTSDFQQKSCAGVFTKNQYGVIQGYSILWSLKTMFGKITGPVAGSGGFTS
jgi:hypothetical protein